MSLRKSGRKPANIVAANKHTTPDIVWAAIRELKEFTRESLVLHLDKDNRVMDETIFSYVQSLHKGGFLTVDRKKHVRGVASIYFYRLVKDVGVEAPRLTRSGKICTQGKTRENLWRTMRIIGEFNYNELAIAASTEETPIKGSTAKDYIKHLYSAGYLVCVKECVRGNSRIPARYRLLKSKFTGPRPPQVQRVKQVFDPNLNEVVCEEAPCN